MKRLKKNQLGPWCTFCEGKKARAVYRQEGFMGSFSCEEHVSQLEEVEARDNDDRITLADELTWYSL